MKVKVPNNKDDMLPGPLCISLRKCCVVTKGCFVRSQMVQQILLSWVSNQKIPDANAAVQIY